MSRYLFGECPICRQGQLLAVTCAADAQILVMCDDCESQWQTPQDAKSFENALTVEVHEVKEATAEEVEAAGWASSATS